MLRNALSWSPKANDKESVGGAGMTPKEEEILDEMREWRGDEFVEAHKELILLQARRVGEL